MKYLIKKLIRKSLNEAYLDSDGNLKNMFLDLSQEDMNEIFKGYLESALWTEEERLRDEATSDIDTEDMDEVEKLIALKGKFDKDNFVTFVTNDIDVNSRIDSYSDIKNFIKLAGEEAVNEAIEDNGLFRLGMDIWLTRNHHGSGFFDHSYENEDKLTAAGHKLGSKDLYVGDDNKLYFT
jgi:uncharacterized protein YbcC (UPF0753/DUF2309 family)